MTELTDDIKEAMREFHNAYGDGLREAMNIPADWKFIDSPKIATKDFVELQEVVGDAEVRFVVMSSGPFTDSSETWTRYTAFYSPEAQERVREWAKIRFNKEFT